MRIAITGGSGRIGRAVVQLALAQGYSIINIDRTVSDEASLHNVTEIQADLTDYDAFVEALEGCEALIHLAAIPSPWGKPDHEVHNNNVVTNYNALRAAVERGIQRICLASSINAIGAAFSRWPHYDYLPVDEQHPTYSEDPYSLSKWIGEQQADSFARRYEQLTIASLRFHGITDNLPPPWQKPLDPGGIAAKQLWGYTHLDAAARACLLALTADFIGHEVFYIVAPETGMALPSQELKDRFFPDVAQRSGLSGHCGFFNCEKAERLLGWRHDD